MLRRFAQLALALAWSMCVLSHVGASASSPSQPDAFVRVRGTQFVIGDRPFRFVGANASVMHGPNERRDYEKVLDAVAADGLKVIRIWALGEFEAPGEPHHPLYAFRIGENGWLEESFAHLDRVLVAARERDLRVIVVLANRWKDYGGIARYLSWAGVTVSRDERGEPLGTGLASFYACARCQTLYRDHVQRVVGRVNRVSGVAYREDPTILAWELINEASAVTAVDEEALISWVQESARFVRSLDPNHLISAGHVGYRAARERRVWRAVQALPEVDFADVHAYPLSDRRILNTARLARFMDDPIALAQIEIEKPLVFGEFGFERGPKLSAHARRVRWIEAFLAHAAQRGAAGSLIWIYEPADNQRRQHSISPNPQDLGSLRVREVLRTGAMALASQRAGAPHPRWTRTKNLPQFALSVIERSSLLAHRIFVPQGTALTLEMDALAFALAKFERTGVYRQGALDSVFGAGEGFIEYRFVAPKMIPRGVVIEARVSSELPGHGDGLDARDGSDVEISLDGEVVGTARAIPDDGLGEVIRVELRDRRALRKIFGRARRHALRFTALPSRYAGGLCIYGRPTGAVALAPEAQRELQSVRLTLE